MRRYKALPTNLPVPHQDPIPLSAEFMQQLKAKQARLLDEKKQLQARLKDAREMGDLSENGAYKYAKIELGSVGKQLSDTAFLLTHGYVAEARADRQIGFGSRVTLSTQDKEVSYLLVSEYEADIANNKLSLKSPLGSLLVDKSVGELVTLKSVRGETNYTITKVEVGL